MRLRPERAGARPVVAVASNAAAGRPRSRPSLRVLAGPDAEDVVALTFAMDLHEEVVDAVLLHAPRLLRLDDGDGAVRLVVADERAPLLDQDVEIVDGRVS